MGMQTPISQMPTFDDFMDELDSEGYLEHYGTKGHSGRYPLGSGDRPYQDYGGLSPRASKKAKKAYDRQKEKTEKRQKKEAKKAAVEKAKEDKKKADEEAEAKKKEEAFQKERTKILRDPNKLYKERYNSEYNFTEEEIQKSLKNFEWDKKIHEYKMDQLQRPQRFLDNSYKYLTTAMKYWNFGAGVANAINPDLNLRKIDIGAKSNKDKDKDEDKKPKKDEDKKPKKDN